MNDCSCGSFGSDDLRSLLYAAACSIHAQEVFGIPKIKEPKRLDHCGDCSKWMISSQCPQERNINGWNHGPSMSGPICAEFSPSGRLP